MGRVFRVYDEALDGFVQAELLVTGTLFLIGLGLGVLGMALAATHWGSGWLIRAPLVLGGIGAMLIATRAFYQILN